MPQTRPNGVITPIPSDDYNPPQDMADMADSILTIVEVADEAARDSLGSLYPGGILPNPFYVSRADLGGEIEFWNGLTWRTLNDTGVVITSDSNWGYSGGLIRARGVNRTHVQLSLRMSRLGGNVNLTTTYLLICNLIPTGWYPIGSGAFGNANVHTGGNVFKFTCPFTISPTGDLLMQVAAGAGTINTGDFFTLDVGWHK